MKNIAALFCGFLFGIGLSLSGMTDTNKVIGFLDVFGNWIPDLLFVMGSAVIVTMIGLSILKYFRTPLLDTKFHLPTNKYIDTRLVSGAVIFGVGWGLYGYCPGPAIAALSYLNINTFIFVAFMAIGMSVANFIKQ